MAHIINHLRWLGKDIQILMLVGTFYHVYLPLKNEATFLSGINND